MKKSILLLAAICAIPFMSCNDDNDESESSTVLCPFADGNKWFYSVEYRKADSLQKNGEEMQCKSFTVDGKTGYTIGGFGPTNDKNFSLMGSDKKGNVVELHFKDGKYFGESIIYKRDAKAGEKYKVQMMVEGEDGGELYDMDMACVKRDTTLNVPAGDFKCICYCMTIYEDGAISDKFYSFYAENVGLVQDVRYEFSDKEGKDSVMMNKRSLASYELK